MPSAIKTQLREVEALRQAILEKGFQGADGSIDDLLAKAPDPGTYDRPWYVTFVLDQPATVTEDPTAVSERGWWDWDAAQAAREKFRSDARQALDVVAAHVATILGAEFLSDRTDEHDQIVLLGAGKPLSIVPVLSFSASGSVRRSAARFPDAALRERLGALGGKPWGEHRWLLRSVQWYMTSLVADDPWRTFQTSWLALEILVHKVGERYRQAVLERLASQAGQSVAGTAEIAGSGDRASLTQKFVIVALELSPGTVDEDLAKFKRAKKGRDRVSHGDIDDPEDLPIGETCELCRKYIDLALRHLTP